MNEITDVKEEINKTQGIRLLDVFVIAPICFYAGLKYYDKMPKLLALSLITIGVSTAVFNGRNFIITKKNK